MTDVLSAFLATRPEFRETHPWDLRQLAEELAALAEANAPPGDCDDCLGCDCCEPLAEEPECCDHCIHELVEAHPR